MNPFNESRLYFMNCIDYDPNTPFTYDQWLKLPHDYKVAVLYLQFYDAISLACSKTVNRYSDSVVGYEELMEYIIKAVPKIEEDESKFSARYLYRLSWNTLVCLYNERTKFKNTWQKEITENWLACMNGGSSEEDNDCLWEKVESTWTTIEDNMAETERDQLLSEFWEAVGDLSFEDSVVVDKALGIDSALVAERASSYSGYLEWQANNKNKKLPNANFKRAVSIVRDKLSESNFSLAKQQRLAELLSE